MPGRIRPRKLQKNTSFIDTDRNQVLLDNKNKNMNFSLKYFKEDTDFHINHEDPAYLQTVIKRFRDISLMSFSSMMANRSSALRMHRIDWTSGSVSRDSFNIPGEEDLYDEAYQFSVSGNEHGRVMGFFTDNQTFNIVWFDKDHDLYPGN